jgi:hypothetical protein
MVRARLVSAEHRRSLGRATDPGDDFTEAFDGCGEGQDRLIETAVGQNFAGDSRRVGICGLGGGDWLSRPSDRRAGTFGSGTSGHRANTKAAVVPVKPVPLRAVGVGEGVMAPAVSGLERAPVQRRDGKSARSSGQRPLQRPMQPDGGIASPSPFVLARR